MNQDENQNLGGMAAEDLEDQDLIEGVDEDGNKVLLQVVRYFYYNGEEYVVLGDAQQEDECGCGCEECAHHHEEAEECGCDECDEEEDPVNLYIMKVVETTEDGEELEEFTPVEDEALLEKLIEVVQTEFENEEAEDQE